MCRVVELLHTYEVNKVPLTWYLVSKAVGWSQKMPAIPCARCSVLGARSVVSCNLTSYVSTPYRVLRTLKASVPAAVMEHSNIARRRLYINLKESFLCHMEVSKL